METLLGIVALLVGLGCVVTPWILSFSTHLLTATVVVAGGALVGALGVVMVVVGHPRLHHR